MVGRRGSDGRIPFGAANRMKTTPIPVQRTTRTAEQRVLTSLPAGKMVPLAVIPLLREDSITGGQFRVGVEMKETVELLMNSVNVRLMAYLVPKLALERFDGLDSINRSYEGIPDTDGGSVIPWFETVAAAAPGVNKILYHLGKHARLGTMINTEYTEAYNVIWNFRAANRSPDITPRTRLQMDLAPGFWNHQTFAHVVPDFDQAIIDGEVALNVVNSKMPVRGFGQTNGNTPASTTIVEADGLVKTAPGYKIYSPTDPAPVAGQAQFGVLSHLVGTTNAPDVWAELQDNGITVSLSNIEMARKTQAFANLRRQYSGHSDEYIIDLLMDGITIPDQSWKHPILLADNSTVIGMSKRYASDGASLTESVVNGMTMVDLRFSCPRVPMGGCVMIVCEIAPEQLFERQKDPYLHATDVDDLPQFLRDTLDPEKVVVVKNDYVDIDHDTPDATFGYAPLNHEWAKSQPHIGGKFFRPTVDAAFDEDRQRIWAVETQNPVLSEDFYLVTAMHYKPFVVTDLNIDPFEALLRGNATIRGNTIFGGLLVEATNDYAEVVEEQPVERIDKPDAPAVP